jgi:predicted component of type VI protein secretion system
MTRSRASALGAVLLAGALLSACSRGSHQDTSQPPRAVKNPSDFPLYPRSEVVNVVPVDTAPMFAVIHANDPSADLPQNFHGHVIIAETGATLAQLRGWVAGLEAAPPHGLRDTTSHTTRSSRDKNRVELNGDGTAQFEAPDSSRWVYVITADPRRIHEQAGPLFTLIDAYTAAPSFLRAPIDDEAKKQTGYTVTQMLDAKSPAGAVVAELKRLQSADRRAILLIDEAKTK